jgi:dipeptidyl-peptidase III
LVETYAVKVDRLIHEEILSRYKKLKLAPYGGFINPNLLPVYKNNLLTDVLIDYTESFDDQMIRYGKEFGYL